MAASLKSRITRHISMSGPLPLAEFMHWCMSDPEHGYYTNQQAIGSEADFITAPEISQMFGELIGVWAIEAWQSLGRPRPFNLVELGPGKGTMMKDLLRAGNALPEFLAAAQAHMIETSNKLAEHQKQTLGQYTNVSWHQSLQDIPRQPTIIIANEFLDVLPVRQYIKAENQWRERAVNTDKEDNLIWTLGTGILDAASLPKNADREPDGAIFERSSAREAYVANTAELLKSNSGSALFIDYGHGKTGFGDTLQAMRAHEYAEILSEPGSSDLTSHVDFDALSKIIKASGLKPKPLMTQGDFLLKLGLLERAGQLGHNQSPEIQESLTQQAERLALPHEMGDLFKVFEFGMSQNKD